MKELYSRQTTYPIGQPFTTDVMRTTLNSVEKGTENNQYARVGNLMAAVQWPVSFLGYMLTAGTATYEWTVLKFQILSTGVIEQAHSSTTVTVQSARLKFYPSLSYPSNIGATSGGVPVDTAFATYLVGSGSERSCLVMYPKSVTSDYGELYTRDVVFTFVENGSLTGNTITCVADDDSKETLPNGNDVYYKWTIVYGPDTTATDIYTYLNSVAPFNMYFTCTIYDDNTGPVTMPSSTSKNIFFMRQGLSVTMPQATITRFLLGMEYILNASFPGTGNHELCIYLRLPYSEDVRDNVTYFSHLDKFAKASYTGVPETDILFSWEMSTEEADENSLIPLAYRDSDEAIIFIDGTRFYKSKMSNNSFIPATGARTFELGGVTLFGTDGGLIDVNSLGGVGELDLIDESNAGYYKLLNRFWWYATDDTYTFYRYVSGSAIPVLGISRTSGSVTVGGGVPVMGGAEVKLAANTRTGSSTIESGDAILSLCAPTTFTGYRSAILFGQKSQTEYSTLAQVTQTSGSLVKGMYLTTHLGYIFIGTHDKSDPDMLVPGTTYPRILITDTYTETKAANAGIKVKGDTYSTIGERNSMVLSTTDTSVTVHPTNGVTLRNLSGYVIAKDSGNSMLSEINNQIQTQVGGVQSTLNTGLTYFQAIRSENGTDTDFSEMRMQDYTAYLTSEYLYSDPDWAVAFIQASSSTTVYARMFAGLYTGAFGTGMVLDLVDTGLTLYSTTNMTRLPGASFTQDTPVLSVTKDKLRFKYEGTSAYDDTAISMKHVIIGGTQYMAIESEKGLVLRANAPYPGQTGVSACNVLTANEAADGSGVRALTLAAQRAVSPSTLFTRSAAVRLDTDEGAIGTFSISFWGGNTDVWEPAGVVFTVETNGDTTLQGDLTLPNGNLIVDAGSIRSDGGYKYGSSFTGITQDIVLSDGRTLQVKGGIITAVIPA